MDENQLASSQETGLFSGVVFAIIESSKLPRDHFYQIIRDLTSNGAAFVQTTGAGQIDNIRTVNTIISATADFPDYEDALDRYVHVVKPSWIQHSIAKKKQVNPRQHSPDPALFMSDVIITCAGLPQGDVDAIAGGVIAMGGQYSEALAKTVTHLITLDPECDVCELALARNLSCDILLPHWFDDCLRLGRRLSENPYLFPNPAVWDSDWKGPPTGRQSEMIIGATTYSPQKLPGAIEDRARSRPVKVFDKKSVMLSEDLNISDDRKRAISQVIEDSNGRLVEDVALADIFVCQYRTGADYITASQQGKTVANLSWLFYIITHDVWTSPMRRLMHYPIPKNGIPGFEDKLISLTNYTGEARVYLQFLIQALGAQFSRTMKEANTHLIVAHQGSEKCVAAKEWNIEIVNHLWLEESYVKCKATAISNPKYNHFPLRSNLDEVVGQIQLDRKIIESIYYPVVTAPLQRSPRKSVITSRPSTAKPEAPALLNLENMVIDEPTPAKIQEAKRARNGVLQTPIVNRLPALDKENDTPGSTGSRGAKDRARNKLLAAASDIALFNKEMKRVGGVVHGRSRGENSDEVVQPKAEVEANTRGGRKRKSTESDPSSSLSTADGDDTESDAASVEAAGPKTKRAKIEKRPPIMHRMIVTFYERWSNKPDLEPTDRNKLRNLGLHVVDDPTNVTILCAPHIVRSRKFVCALANAPHVVSTDFLDACLKSTTLKSATLPNLDKFLIKDADAEQRFGFELYPSLQRAKSNNHNFLNGWQIFCTDKVVGGFDTFSSIIKVNGGTCHLYKGRTNMSVSKRPLDRFSDGDPVAESQLEDGGETLFLLSGTSAEEKALWSNFRTQAARADMTPVISKTEWILAICMAQEFRWDDMWKLD